MGTVLLAKFCSLPICLEVGNVLNSWPTLFLAHDWRQISLSSQLKFRNYLDGETVPTRSFWPQCLFHKQIGWKTLFLTIAYSNRATAAIKKSFQEKKLKKSEIWCTQDKGTNAGKKTASSCPEASQRCNFWVCLSVLVFWWRELQLICREAKGRACDLKSSR
jgi:hypothetical protein